MRYGREGPVRVDGSTWKSALYVPRAMWGLMLSICVMSVVLMFRFPPASSPRDSWWVVPLVASILLAAGFLLPPWLEARGLAKKRAKADERDGVRVFRSAKKTRTTYVEAILTAYVAGLGLPTMAGLVGALTFMDSGHLFVALPFVVAGLVTVALRFPRSVDWQARAEAAYGARFPDP